MLEKNPTEKEYRYFEAETIDDLMRAVMVRLLDLPPDVRPSKGSTSEIIGATLRLENPRARLSRSETRGRAFSALGELLWYLAKTDDLKFIEYYIRNYGVNSDDGKTVFGAYGPRLFQMRGEIDQFANVRKLLKKKPSSRRAVIQLFNAEDLVKHHKDVPCTCTLQFMIRKNRLELVTTMRSNDVYLGLPHDIFAFTMLQEIMARSLGVELGAYTHFVGSLHLYKKDVLDTKKFIREGWQTTRKPMPPMPSGNPMPALQQILVAANDIRSGREVVTSGLKLSPYWSDLVRLLQIHSICKKDKFLRKDREKVALIKDKMCSQVFGSYIDQMLARKAK